MEIAMAQVRAFNPRSPSIPRSRAQAAAAFDRGRAVADRRLLIDNAAWDRIGDVVREADFYRDDHRRIFRHIGKLIQRGVRPTW
jgi:replicative DNA helicase